MRTMQLSNGEQETICDIEQGMRKKKTTRLVLVCNQGNKWNAFAAGDFGLTVKEVTSLQIIFVRKKGIKGGAKLQTAFFFLYWFRLFIVQDYSKENLRSSPESSHQCRFPLQYN